MLSTSEKLKALTYINRYGAKQWNESSHLFACQSDTCRIEHVTYKNSGVYNHELGIVFCWQPNCSYNRYNGATSISKYLCEVNGLSPTLKNFRYLIGDEEEYEVLEKKEIISNISRSSILPSGTIPITIKSKLYENVESYLFSRGFTDIQDFYNRYKVGYCVDESSKYFGYLIFPYYDINKNYIYYQARNILPKANIRWKSPDNGTCPVDKRDAYIISSYAKDVKDLCIVEGAFDFYEIDYNSKGKIAAMGLLGINLTVAQINLIKSLSNIDNIYICTDANTLKAAFDMAYMLLNYTDKDVYITKISETIVGNKKYKDINDYGYEVLFNDFLPSSFNVNISNISYLKTLIKYNPVNSAYTIDV